MIPERWARVEELYEAALDLEPARRAPYLDEHCAGDAELRREVDSLLFHDEHAGRFLAVRQDLTQLSKGTRVSHYEIEKKIGEGGMGVVFQARDTRLDRSVALKFVRGQFTERFEREARAVAALNHPNIATLYDVGHHEGAPYLVMELIDGKPLKGPVPVKEVVALGIKIAGALAAAHAAGIIHRDLKPGNILITREGQVKLLDFGLARRVHANPDQQATITVQGEIAGTPAYMSPEQAEGKPADARSDVFSFGLVLYYLLTGRPAFTGDSSAAVLSAVLREDPLPLGGKVPAGLERIVGRCLRKDAARRYHNIEDVRIELEDLEQEAPAPARPPRRRWLWASGALAIVLAAVAVLVWGTRPAAPTDDLKAVPLTTYPGPEYAPTFSADGNRVAFSWTGGKEDALAHIYIKQVGVGASPVRLTNGAAAEYLPAWSPDDRWIAYNRRAKDGFEIVVSPSLGGAERVLASIAGTSFLSWAPGSKWIAFSAGETGESVRSIWCISMDTRERRRLTTTSAKAANVGYAQGDGSPALSPDGRTLAFVREAMPYNYDLYLSRLTPDLKPEGEPIRLTDRQYPGMSLVAWTADGRDLVYAAGGQGSRTLWRIPASGLGGAKRLSFAFRTADAPAIARAQPRLAYAWSQIAYTIWRLNVRTGEKTRLYAATGWNAYPRYSPDRSRIALSTEQSGELEIWTCDANGEGCAQVTSFGGLMLGSPRWSPDGQWLVHDCVKGQHDIYVTPASGGESRNITNHPSADNSPSWSHDGRWIYFASDRSGKYEIWKIPPVGGAAVQVTRTGGTLPFESPDGRYLYYKKGRPMGPGTVCRVPVVGGAEEEILPKAIYYSVTRTGVYFAIQGEKAIWFLNSLTKKINKLAAVDKNTFSLSASEDDAYVLWSQMDQISVDLMLVEGFR